jgi:hypothetical protein
MTRLALLVMVLLFAACTDADVASRNISKEADMFRVNRRIVFYNGINGEYILVVEGFCSLGNLDAPGELSVTCKTGDAEYKKHYLGLSDNVTYFSEQVESAGVGVDHYKVIFKPGAILPDIDLE